MSNDKKYLLDGEPVSFTEIIYAARARGYEPDDGIYKTSEAARILRTWGFTVEEGPA